jgi:SAM-dependent methyltransferase
MVRDAGRLMDARGLSLREFVEAYRRVRAAEGLASDDPAVVAALPFRDLTGRNRALWRARALHYLGIRACLRAIPWVSRVLDLGAGNGWMARRLARRFQVTALDADAGPAALGALGASPVLRVRGELGALPFAGGSFDAVVAAASLHYAPDVAETLREVARVLVPRGVLLLADSPVYADAIARARAAQRTAAYYASLGEPQLAARYGGLTRAELEGPGLFRFVTLAPGISVRGTIGAFRRHEPPGARLPLLIGWRR